MSLIVRDVVVRLSYKLDSVITRDFNRDHEVRHLHQNCNLGGMVVYGLNLILHLKSIVLGKINVCENSSTLQRRLH
jgi:hypothetical protein